MIALRPSASPLLLAPNPVLREESRPVTQFNRTLREYAQGMASIMDAYAGIGLAAPQTGSLLSLALLRIDEERVLPLVNPKILEREGETVAPEGCLSLPGEEVLVPRAESIFLRAQDLEGEEFESEFEGLIARIAQHEIDHLHGRLIVDYRSSSLSEDTSGDRREN